MKLKIAAAVLTAMTGLSVMAQNVSPVKKALPVSLELEAKASVRRGVDFMVKQQGENGAWMRHPAITSLAVMALANSFSAEEDDVKASIEKGLAFIRSNVQEDGSIWNKQAKEYPNYSTSVSLMALAFVNKPEDEQIIRNARKFLIDSQFVDCGEDSPSYGGIGYGKNLRPDLSNTQLALEALFMTDYLDREPYAKDPEAAKKADAMWERARVFLSRCQNLTATNDQEWASDDEENKGSFIYLPENEESKAGDIKTADGNKILRGYGSMTYAGIKSMIYARVDKDDQRVKAASEWMGKNYTLDENPGMDQQGLYYYIHTMAKALHALGKPVLTDAEGKDRDWQYDIAKKLIGAQRANGEWYNDEGRWWESMPELVTSYSLLSLELILKR